MSTTWLMTSMGGDLLPIQGIFEVGKVPVIGEVVGCLCSVNIRDDR